jgi:chromosome segregation ATPase
MTNGSTVLGSVEEIEDMDNQSRNDLQTAENELQTAEYKLNKAKKNYKNLSAKATEKFTKLLIAEAESKRAVQHAVKSESNILKYTTEIELAKEAMLFGKAADEAERKVSGYKGEVEEFENIVHERRKSSVTAHTVRRVLGKPSSPEFYKFLGFFLLLILIVIIIYAVRRSM